MLLSTMQMHNYVHIISLSAVLKDSGLKEIIHQIHITA